MIYVLVVVILFAALGFILARQGGNAESGGLEEERIKVYAGEIIQMANQVKQGVDQMIYSGSDISDLGFCQPGDVCFSSGAVHQVFNPAGGGLIMPRVPPEALDDAPAIGPDPGWHMGRFNNVEWTQTAATDVIFTAHRIRRDVCERINDMLFGDPAPKPLVGVEIPAVLVDPGGSSLDAVTCPTCEGLPAACVANPGGTMWSYYSVIEQR